jgi:hypothetical protein|tara:strand:+ start:768 stop:1466 length:699 start_codon:yes stop_codon:yes gene_type:complete
MTKMQKAVEAYKETFGFDTEPVELHPDLEASLVETELFGTMLKHPLVFDAFYVKGMYDKRLNEMLRSRQEAVNKAFVEKEWPSYIFLHERPYRLDAFVDIEEHLGDAEYWEFLANVWTDTENAWQNLDVWRKLWNSFRTRPPLELPVDTRFVTIYRGVRDLTHDGLSWTLNRDSAKWFGNRFGSGYLLEATVLTSDILFYSNERNEEEVLLNAVNKISVTPVPEQRHKNSKD